MKMSYPQPYMVSFLLNMRGSHSSATNKCLYIHKYVHVYLFIVTLHISRNLPPRRSFQIQDRKTKTYLGRSNL